MNPETYFLMGLLLIVSVLIGAAIVIFFDEEDLEENAEIVSEYLEDECL